MRRLFHGRMVSVDGHCRRMEVNYDKYVIAVNSNIGYSLLNRVRQSGTVGARLEWNPEPRLDRITALIPLIKGHSYTLYPTKSGYEIYLGFYDEALTLIDDVQWQDEAAFVPDPGYLYVSIRNKADTAATIVPGEVGLILEDDGED